MKKKTYILTFLMMLCSLVFGQTYHWEQPMGWESNMIVYGKVLIDGQAPAEDLDLELGAFCGNQLRGRQKVNLMDDNELVINGNDGNAITFKLCDKDGDLLDYECVTTINFVANDIIQDQVINFKSSNHWNPAHNTNSNMTVTAKVTINGANVNVNGDYEIGAFIGDNVCGSARVNSNSIAYIVISNNLDLDDNGNPINGTNNVTFKLWDHKNDVLAEEITDVTLNYGDNATQGTITEPYVINFNEAVAQVGDKNFATLQAAVNATTAENTEEVTVLRSFTLDNTVTIANNQTVVLNLGGNTVTTAWENESAGKHYYAFTNNGTLTIQGNGIINARGIFNYGTMTLTEGTINAIDGNGGYGVRNYDGSVFTMNGGTIATTLEDDKKVDKGGYDATTLRVDAGATAIINGGVINNICDYTFAIDNAGTVTVTVNAGTVTSVHSTVSNNGTMTINGGSFTCNGLEGITAHALVAWDGSTTTINGGTFDGKDNYNGFNVDADEGANVVITGGEFLYVHSGSLYGNGTITVSGGTFFDEVGEARLAQGYICEQDGSIYKVVRGLKGSGTVDDPFIIMNLNDLVFFRDHVNNGGTKYNAPGKWVALGADIDMAGVNWVGIGSATAEHGFMGNFDGKTYTISNLTITNPALDSDGYAYAGLFAVTEGTETNQNTIKNLTIENVTITTTGHIVSAAIAYPYYTIVDNVKVCGNIAITGGDYTAGVLAYTRRCVNASNLSIDGTTTNNNNNSFIKGNQTVGGVISDIQMNGGLTAVYNNFSAEGLTITGTKSVGGISGIIGAQTLNGATVKNVTLNCSDARVGVVSGSMGATSTISTVVAENVTGATAIIGATFDDGKPVEAKIVDTYYSTFDKAYAAAQADSIITVLNQVVITEDKTYDKNINVTGATASPMFRIQNGASVVVNNANITNNNHYVFVLGASDGSSDGSSDGNLTIESGTYLGETTVASVTKGLLTIKGGEFEISDVDTYDYAYLINCIDDNYKDKTAKVEIKGGTFYGFDPENNAAEGAGTNFCAEGFISDANSDGSYTVRPGFYVAMTGDVKYETLQAAIDACVEGENTITLLANIDEDVTVVQAPNTKVTINGADKDYTGTITVDVKSAAYETAALNIVNVNFDASNITKDASINLGGSNATRYTSNVTVDNCTFVGTYMNNGQEKVGIKNYTAGCQNLTVTNCSASGLHSLVQVKGVTGENGLTVAGVKIIDGKNGIAVGTSTNVNIKNSTINVTGYGVRADGDGAYNMTLNDNTITANLPVVVRYTTGEYRLTVESGSYTSTNNGYVVTFTKGDDGTFEAPTGDAKATININGGVKSFGFVAKNVNQFYTLFADAAVKDVKNGETIKLLSDVTLVGGYDEATDGLRIEKAVNAASGYESYTIDGNGYTIDCGSFTKGIRVYNNNGTYAANAQVIFRDVTIINNNAQGRCIDTRTANIALDLNKVNLIAEGTNSQPLTIGGSDATYSVKMGNTTINAGTSGYGVICFVPVQAGISASSNTNISGFAAFYIKNNACTTKIDLGHGTYVGTNLFSKASGDFGTIVVEGSNNKINLTIASATVRAVAGDNTAAQAAFAIRGANNVIDIQKEGAQVVTEGEKAFWAMIDDDVANATEIIDNGTDLSPAAKCGGYHFMSLEEAYRYADEENSTITLVRNIELAEIFAINKAITLDLGGRTVTSTAKKAFEVYANATIKNGTINGVNRCVDTRKAVELTLSGVTLNANEYTSAYGNPQPLTIGGSENGTKVNMTNVNISAEDGYGIISFVKTELTATNSTIGGYSALYVKPGSEGSTFIFNNSTLSGSTAGNDVEGNSFSTIAVRADDVTVTVDAESTVNSNGNYCHAISLGGKFANEETTEGNNVTIAGTISGNILSSKCINDNTVKINKEYADELKAEGFATVAIEGTNLVLVVGKAIAEVNGTYYATLDAAAKAANGAEITIIRDFTEKYIVADGAVVNIDFNSHKMNGYILAPNAELTIANGAIVNDVDEDYSTIEIKAGKLNLNDVKMSSKRHAVRIEGDVEAIINGGEYTLIEKVGRTQHALNVSGAANVIINGGKFVGPKGTLADSGSAINVQSGAEVIIYDGFYSGGKEKTLASAGELVLYGGKYDQKPETEYLAEKYTVIETTIENVKWHEVVKAEAKIGETLYATLQGAVDAAQNGETVVIVDNFTVTETVVVSGEKAITLDLNKYTVAAGENVFPVIRIQGDADLTVENGNMTNEDAYIFILGASDSSTYGNLTIKSGIYQGATSVASVTYGTLNVISGEYSVKPYNGSYAYLINCVDANYTNDKANVSISGGIFHNWNPENNAAEGEGTNFCAVGYEAVEVEEGVFFVMPKTSITQSTYLDSGWNWFSLYVDIDGQDGLNMLRNSLTDGLQIKNSGSFTQYEEGYGWRGSLSSVSVNDMYMIHVGEEQTINLEANPVNPADYTITINENWTWIGYPSKNSTELGIALEDLNPTENDYIKSQNAFAEYTGGEWRGSLQTMIPGEGYMYKNVSGEVKTFVYSESAGAKGEAPANITAANNLMVPNMTKYANNMNITAVVNIDGEELMTEDFEVAVFAGEELRGSARPIYIESINRYMLFITVYGEENEELTFKYYDLNSGEELNLFADSKVVFEINSIIGSVGQPSVLNYGTLSIDETSASSFNVYPNPVNRDNAISFETTFDKVEVYNSLGVVVAEYANVDQIDGIEAAGIYVIKVTNDNVVKYCRVIVK